MKKILIISPDFPYPDNHGGRKDVWNQIICLNEMGYDLSLICTVKYKPDFKDVTVVNGYVNNLTILERSSSLLDLLSVMPHQLRTRKGLSKIEIKEKYDYVLLIGDYTIPILFNKTLNKDTNIIFRTHNNETIYFKELGMSERNIIKKVHNYFESIKFYLLNRKYLVRLSTIWFISKDEMESFKSKNKNFRKLFVPPHIPSNGYLKENNKAYNVLFIGSFFMANNREAIAWYLKNIHDKLSMEINYKFTIAGNSKGQSIDWLLKLISKRKFKDNIIIYNTPVNLDEIYKQNTIFVNPMLHGAGVKLKTIEAIQKGLAVVSTKIGVEGTGLENNKHVFITNEADGFREKIIYLLKNCEFRKEMVSNSQQYLLKEFNLKEKIRNFLCETKN